MIEFVSGISVVCFAASSLVALACEVSRLWVRSGLRGAAMVGFMAAGLLAHTIFLVWRGVNEPAVPLSSAFDWYLLAAWVLAGGAHHTVLSLALATEHLEDFAEIAGIELAVIDRDTRLRSFKDQLRNSDLYYHLAQGIHG